MDLQIVYLLNHFQLFLRLRRIKDFSEKSKIELRTAFTKYLEESFKKHSMIKTILYKNQPKYLYDFFECNDLKLDGDIIDCSNVNNILAISNFNLIVGNGGMGKSTLMKHFSLIHYKCVN